MTNEHRTLILVSNSIKSSSDCFFSDCVKYSVSSRRRYIAAEIEKFGKGNISAQAFTFRELCLASQNFDCESLLGSGGFGYCSDGDQRILVYEFMPNGSLEGHLLELGPDQKPLDWYMRMKIAAGAARGLAYLHETANPPVIYPDFKVSNILLDENFNPKSNSDRTHVSTRVMGTYGYCAPDYACTSKLTVKSDVYSFGVVFLEIITGRRVIDSSRPSEEKNIVMWARPLIADKKKLHLMADPLLEGNYPIKALYKDLAFAAMCLQEDANTRPLISKVVTLLEYISNIKKHDDHKEETPDDTFKSPPALQTITSHVDRIANNKPNCVGERY
ncbi:hypothetical protein K7X08_005439 [Anisodus acutangulus]|uniref:Protein kinase domain-containing protein n=1 Tax=Anisodus acutangulus TaxID=402998 RepID=A0A9Q1R782_9SOLA|nr:hypothetical protein K7X08_005439 [Anisodus acutangulus]